MSIVYVNYHNENVADWGVERVNDIFRPTKYTSKHKKRIIEEKIIDVIDIEPNKKLVRTTKPTISLHKTMGYPVTPLKSQFDYLRKNEGIKCIKERTHSCGQIIHRAPVPKRADLKKQSQIEIKNYEKLNIENVKSAKTRRPLPKYADTKNGDTHELCKAGIMPAYIYAPNFGKIPRYLLKINKKLCTDKYLTLAIPKSKGNFDLLNLNQRNELLTGLKSRWLDTQRVYQTLPVFTDTISKVQRKTRLENELRQLEADILLIENNPYIYISE